MFDCLVKEFKEGDIISYLKNKYDVSLWNKEYDEWRLVVDNRGKGNKKDTKIILEEHIDNNEIYVTIRLKKHIENKYKIIFNYKKIMRYKAILGLSTIKHTKKVYLFIY